MSKEALEALEVFMLEDPLASELKPHLVSYLWILALKCGSKDPYVYFLGDEYLAKLFNVSTKTIRNNRKELESLKILFTIQEHAFRSRNKRVRLCLLPEVKGGSPLPPLEGSEVEVKRTNGGSEGGSPTPERWKPASSKKGENKKKESKGEQFFNELIPRLDYYYRSIKWGSNLEKLFNDLAANHKPEVVAHFINRKKLGKVNNEGFMFEPFIEAVEEYLEDPRQAVEEFKKYEGRQISEDLNVALERSPLTPDKQAEVRSLFESQIKKNQEQK